MSESKHTSLHPVKLNRECLKCSKCEFLVREPRRASRLAHIVGRSANYSWLCEEGLKKIMKNVLMNLKVETSSVVVNFKSSSSRFKMPRDL